MTEDTGPDGDIQIGDVFIWRATPAHAWEVVSTEAGLFRLDGGEGGDRMRIASAAQLLDTGPSAQWVRCDARAT